MVCSALATGSHEASKAQHLAASALYQHISWVPSENHAERHLLGLVMPLDALDNLRPLGLVALLDALHDFHPPRSFPLLGEHVVGVAIRPMCCSARRLSQM